MFLFEFISCQQPCVDMFACWQHFLSGAIKELLVLAIRGAYGASLYRGYSRSSYCWLSFRRGLPHIYQCSSSYQVAKNYQMQRRSWLLGIYNQHTAVVLALLPIVCPQAIEWMFFVTTRRSPWVRHTSVHHAASGYSEGVENVPIFSGPTDIMEINFIKITCQKRNSELTWRCSFPYFIRRLYETSQQRTHVILRYKLLTAT